MNLKKTAYLTLLAGSRLGASVACDDFLDVDPSKSTQKTIRTAEQLDALLGSYSRFYSEYNHTALACDDFGLTTDIHDYQNGGMSPSNLEYILWSDQGTGTSRLLWDGEYSKIYYANLVLSYIDEVSGDAETKANLKAEAHFLRAYSMFQLAVAYTLYYDGSNGSELGLPLKQTISFEEGIARASLADTWIVHRQRPAAGAEDHHAARRAGQAPRMARHDGRRTRFRGTLLPLPRRSG